ncbi:MAG: hypothetical protein GEU90_18085 [Gemmatimonas sp.]|nr:hypothetical protein [Gemmatimonas sp.]
MRELARRLAKEPVMPAEPKPLTIAEGVARAFDPNRGMYPVETDHARWSRQLAERAAAILGPSFTWVELTPGQSAVPDSPPGEGERRWRRRASGGVRVRRTLRRGRVAAAGAVHPRVGGASEARLEDQAEGGVVRPDRPPGRAESSEALAGGGRQKLRRVA